MADTTQTTSIIALAQLFRGNVVRQFNRRSATLRVLPILRGEGKNVAFVPEASGMNAENYAEGADATAFGSDAQTSAILPWGQYRATFHVSGLAMAAARGSGTPLGNVQLWGRNLVNASAALASVINAALYNGAGTGTLIAGLGEAIGKVDNIYATIDRSQAANAYFRPIVVDAAAAPLTFAQIRDDIRQIFEASGENPDIALVSPTVFNKVGGLFDPTRRQIQTVTEVTTARGRVVLDMGFQGIEVDGTVFIKDKDATAGEINYLNTNHVHIEYLDSMTPDVKKLLEEVVIPDDGFGALPLGFSYEMLAKTGDSDKAEVKSYLQLACDRPNSCGVRKNIG